MESEQTDKVGKLEERIIELERDNRLMKKLIDSLPVGVQLFDRYGYSVSYNEAHRKILGLPDLTTGIGEFNVLTDEFSKKHGAAEFYKKAYQCESGLTREFKYSFGIHENNWRTRSDERILRETIVPLCGMETSVDAVLAIIEDVTKKRRIEKELIELSHKFERVFHFSPIPIGVANLKGDILLINQSFIKLFGYTHEEIPTITEWRNKAYPNTSYGKISLEQWQKDILDYAAGKTQLPPVREYNIHTKNGDEKQVKVSFDIDDNLIYVAFHDITEMSKQQQKLQSIFANAVSGIVYTNHKGDIIDANRAFRDLIGYTREELIGLNFKRFTLSDDYLEERGKINEAVKQGKDSLSYEKRYLTKTGNIVWVELSVAIVRDLNNNPQYFVGVVNDITNKKKAEKEFRLSEQRWQFALEGAGDGLWDWNLKTNEVFFSRQWKRMLGFKDQEISGSLEEWEKRVHPDDLQKCFSDIKEHLDGKSEFYINEHRVLCKDGTYKWILDRGQVIEYDEGGSPVRMIGTHTDLSERILLEKELKEINASKDRFFSIIAHDLKNPLGAMRGLTGILRDNLKNEKYNHALKMAETLHQATDQTYALLENLLEWSRSQTGKLEFKPEEFNFYDLLEECQQLFHTALENKKIDLKIDARKLLKISADRNMLLTVVRNLMSNAIKYSHANGEIQIRAEIKNNALNCVIRDNGVGIQEKDIAKLFKIDESFTVNGTKNEKGTGLGLILCNDFIKRHDGNLQIRSDYGNWTEVFYIIPVQQNG